MKTSDQHRKCDVLIYYALDTLHCSPLSHHPRVVVCASPLLLLEKQSATVGSLTGTPKRPY